MRDAYFPRIERVARERANGPFRSFNAVAISFSFCAPWGASRDLAQHPGAHRPCGTPSTGHIDPERRLVGTPAAPEKSSLPPAEPSPVVKAPSIFKTAAGRPAPSSCGVRIKRNAVLQVAREGVSASSRCFAAAHRLSRSGDRWHGRAPGGLRRVTLGWSTNVSKFVFKGGALDAAALREAASALLAFPKHRATPSLKTLQSYPPHAAVLGWPYVRAIYAMVHSVAAGGVPTFFGAPPELGCSASPAFLARSASGEPARQFRERRPAVECSPSRTGLRLPARRPSSPVAASPFLRADWRLARWRFVAVPNSRGADRAVRQAAEEESSARGGQAHIVQRL